MEHFQMGTLREIGAEAGDIVEVLGGPRWTLVRVDDTGFYIDDKVAPKLDEKLPFRLIQKGPTMTIRDPSSHEDPKKLWLHMKTGCHYKILYHGLLEKTLQPMVIYQLYDGTGPVWIRTAEEFFDGRFRNWETMECCAILTIQSHYKKPLIEKCQQKAITRIDDIPLCGIHLRSLDNGELRVITTLKRNPPK